MKIPRYSLRRDFRAWLAWRCRVWAGQLEPERPHIMGPFPGRDGRLAWMAMQGETSLDGFETTPIGRQASLPEPDPAMARAALMKAIFPREVSDDE